MTDAQTEARAIAHKVVDLVRGAIHGAVVCHGEMTTAEVESEAADIGLEVADLIAAAFAAKDANIKALGEQMVMERLNAYELQAQLAEAIKALEPLWWLADAVFRDGMNSGKPDDAAVWGFDNIYLTYGHLRIARRAREAQGGENG